MTITTNDAREEYTASASQTVFNYTFKIFEASDLNVYITSAGAVANDAADITTSYTVTGVGAAAGGTIILSVGATVNDLITIVSNIPSSRTTDYQTNGDFLPDTVNDDNDRIVSIVKKIEDTVNRSVLTAQSQQGPKPLSLDQPVAGKILRWNGSEDGLENVSPSDVDITTVIAQDLTITKATIAAAKADDDLANFVGGFVRVAEARSGDPLDSMFIIKAGAAPAGLSVNIVTYNSDTASLFYLELIPSVSGGSTNSNLPSLYADRAYEFGQEYMWFFHRILYDQIDASIPAQADVVFSGDSTTAGNGSLESPSVLFGQMAQRAGWGQIKSINSGQSGQQTPFWNATAAPADIIAFPNMRLYIARWGVNDGTRITADGFEATIDSYRNALRGGLTQLRAFKDVSNLSILLMTPNTISDMTTPRDIRWLEAVRDVVADAARDFQCGFIDTYAYFRDGYRDAWDNHWLADDLFPSGGGVHPDEIHNHWICSKITEFTLDPLRHRGMNNFFNIGGIPTTNQRAVTEQPSSYPYGLTVWRTDGTWSLDGFVSNFRQADGITKQTVYGFADGRQIGFTRFSDPASSLTLWKEFLAPRNLTLINSWALSGGDTARYYPKIDGRVSIEMRVTAGTGAIAVIPAEHRPPSSRYFHTSNGAGTVAGIAFISAVTGEISITSGPTTDVIIHGEYTQDWGT